MIKYCSHTPEQCGLKACLSRGCILNDPPPKITLDKMIENYHDMCARLEIGEFKVSVIEFIKPILPGKKIRNPRRINGTGHYYIFRDLIVDGFIECHYCVDKLTPSRVTRDHIHPKSKGGTIKKGNIVPACMICNTNKGSTEYYEFLLNAGRIGIKLKPDRLAELKNYHTQQTINRWNELDSYRQRKT